MMRLSMAGIGALMAVVLTGPVAAQTGVVTTGSAPGMATVTAAVTISGSIVAIDPATRAVTLKGEGGKELEVTAGPEVQNFGQLHVGDTVSVGIMRALTLELKKGSTAVVSRSDDVGGVRAAAGAKPGGAIGHQVTVMAEVTAVDAEAQIVTLKGPKQSIDLPIADPAQFALISVGDRVEATYVEAVAVSFAPAKSGD